MSEVGLTNVAPSSPLLRAQFGRGPRSDNPQTQPTGWEWSTLTPSGSDAASVWYTAFLAGQFDGVAAGTYSYAFRVSGGLSLIHFRGTR